MQPALREAAAKKRAATLEKKRTDTIARIVAGVEGVATVKDKAQLKAAVAAALAPPQEPPKKKKQKKAARTRMPSRTSKVSAAGGLCTIRPPGWPIHFHARLSCSGSGAGGGLRSCAHGLPAAHAFPSTNRRHKRRERWVILASR